MALFDLDGVISDASHRQHLFRGSDPDWRGFFTSADRDPPLESGVALAASVVDDCSVAVLTARPGYVTGITRRWLAAHTVRHDLLIVRPRTGRGSSGDSADYKRFQLSLLRSAGYQVALAVDDDPRIIRMYRSEGVTALYTHSGYYER